MGAHPIGPLGWWHDCCECRVPLAVDTDRVDTARDILNAAGADKVTKG
jgi:hypothetical protein